MITLVLVPYWAWLAWPLARYGTFKQIHMLLASYVIIQLDLYVIIQKCRAFEQMCCQSARNQCISLNYNRYYSTTNSVF